MKIFWLYMLPLSRPLEASLVPASTHQVFIVPAVRVLVGDAVNHLSTVFPAVKQASVSLGGCVWLVSVAYFILIILKN